jgi:sugar (pentulose or hexulose) kinase
MPGGPLFLGVDVGTQGTKALVYDQKTGKVLSRGARSYDILKTTVPGRAEQHPSAWIEVCHIQHQHVIYTVKRRGITILLLLES